MVEDDRSGSRTCKLPASLKGFNFSQGIMRNFLAKNKMAHKKRRRNKMRRPRKRTGKKGSSTTRYVRIERIEHSKVAY